jgi:hypothetical protein
MEIYWKDVPLPCLSMTPNTAAWVDIPQVEDASSGCCGTSSGCKVTECTTSEGIGIGGQGKGG